MKTAFIFPGQGSQQIGMAQDFYRSFYIAREVFECVNDTLNYDLSKIIFQGPDEDLSATINTQPALMTVSIAILRVVQQETGKNIEDLCDLVAGHSLGEYSALCAAEALSLENTARLLKTRATSMQEACPKGKGGMAACLGISYDELNQMIEDLIEDGACQIANDNVDGQIVISGHLRNIDTMVVALKNKGYKAIKLNVSAPFHSKIMEKAEGPMKKALSGVVLNTPVVPLLANVTAELSSEPNEIKNNLVAQISGTVRWRETMDEFAELGVKHLVEIGSGKVLSGLAKKSPYHFQISNIETISDLKNFKDANL